MRNLASVLDSHRAGENSLTIHSPALLIQLAGAWPRRLADTQLVFLGRAVLEANLDRGKKSPHAGPLANNDFDTAACAWGGYRKRFATPYDPEVFFGQFFSGH